MREIRKFKLTTALLAAVVLSGCASNSNSTDEKFKYLTPTSYSDISTLSYEELRYLDEKYDHIPAIEQLVRNHNSYYDESSYYMSRLYQLGKTDYGRLYIELRMLSYDEDYTSIAIEYYNELKDTVDFDEHTHKQIALLSRLPEDNSVLNELCRLELSFDDSASDKYKDFPIIDSKIVRAKVRRNATYCLGAYKFTNNSDYLISLFDYLARNNYTEVTYTQIHFSKYAEGLTLKFPDEKLVDYAQENRLFKQVFSELVFRDQIWPERARYSKEAYAKILAQKKLEQEKKEQAKQLLIQQKPALLLKTEKHYHSGNYEEAKAVIEPLANVGDSNAMYAMGQILEKQSQIRHARDWYKKAGDHGISQGYNDAAFLEYTSGSWFLEVDKSYMTDLYQKAARLGDRKAQYNLNEFMRYFKRCSPGGFHCSSLTSPPNFIR